MYFPKISIVTPSYNQGQYIEETILSIVNQGYPNLEYIIIDGGSTDNTVEIIKKYEQHLKYWISEKDKGQADAINKGLVHCTGKIFNWINSDDILAEGALFSISAAFEASGAAMVAGAVWNFDEAGGGSLLTNRNLSIAHYMGEAEDYLYHQPGIWLLTDHVRAVGLFNTAYRYSFDQEHLLRYLLQFPTVVYIPGILVRFRLHGASKTVSQFKFFYTELQWVYRDFYTQNRQHPLARIALRKSRNLAWTVMHQSLMDRKRQRLREFFTISHAILRDPGKRLNRKNLGWLKHVLFRPKQKDL